MTKQEWENCKDIQQMLSGLKLSDRKTRLFAVAICRTHKQLDDYVKSVLKELELYADGKWEDIKSTRNSAHTLAQSHYYRNWLMTAIWETSLTPIDLEQVCWLCGMETSFFTDELQCNLLRHMVKWEK